MNEATGHIHIVTSGETRNGKTLLARLLTDFVLLAGGDPLVHDADAPFGRLAEWYPGRAQIVDVETTRGQIALFDRMLGAPRRDHVVDLPARDLWRFFTVAEQTGFVEEAARNHQTVDVLFILDRPDVTLAALRAIRAGLDKVRIVPVLNEAVRLDARTAGGEDTLAALARLAEFRLPRLDREMLRHVERPAFSFAGFLQSGDEELRPLARTVLRGFLRTVFGQFQDLGLVEGAAALARAGLA
jgi:hypothetical protein